MIRIESKAIAWDLDGTLIDSFELFNELLAEVLGRRVIEMPSREVVTRNYHGKLLDTIVSLLPETHGPVVAEVIDEFVGLQDPRYEELEKYVYNDALSLASRAHAGGKRQIVVSNRLHKNQGNGSPKSIISKPPLRGIIDLAVCADDSEFHKPDSRVLDVVIEEFGLCRQDFTVIGDQFVDAMLAKNIGASAILVNRNDHPIPYLEQLGDDWKSFVAVVSSLDKVEVCSGSI